MKKPKRTRSIRIDEALLEAAYEHNLDLSALVEATIVKQLKLKHCPYCGK